MTVSDLVAMARLPVLVGVALWFAGGLLGPRLGAGWTDLIQGLAVFVALVWIAVAATLQLRARRRR